MFRELQGETFEEQLHRIGKALEEGKIPGPFAWWPFTTLIQDINPKRYIVKAVTKDGADQDLRVGPPPEGRVWVIKHARVELACSAVAGNRVTRLKLMYIDRNDLEQLLVGIGAKTAIADETLQYFLGAAVASGDPHSGNMVDAEYVLTEENFLTWVCSAGGDAGDTARIYALVEESINYKV